MIEAFAICRGSCIPVEAVYIKGQLEKVIPSFYDDVICLPVIVAKIEAIQKTLVKSLLFISLYFKPNFIFVLVMFPIEIHYIVN